MNFIEVEITRSFSSVTLLEGNTVTLSCIPSVIETVLSWTHNGEVINEDEDTIFLPMNLNHNLTLHSTVEDDSGLYSCRAQLDNEKVEQSITVTVVPGSYICIIIKIIYAYSYILTLNADSHKVGTYKTVIKISKGCGTLNTVIGIK